MNEDNFGKVSQLKGSRNLIRIECSCGSIWEARQGKKAKLRFMREHADHLLKSFTATSRVYVS